MNVDARQVASTVSSMIKLIRFVVALERYI